MTIKGLVQGKRKYAENGDLWLAEGEYGKHPRNGVWYCLPPDFQYTGNLANHTVTEHEDGMITVSPSILIKGGDGSSWHGYLEKGMWRVC